MLNQDKEYGAKSVFFVFIAGIILYVTLYFTAFGFTRAIRVYSDELRYYGIARSLFDGDGIAMRTIKTAHQNIGYSFILAPFFAIRDTFLRLKAIGMANIVILHLSVIFAWLLAREIGLKKRACLCIAAMATVWPDMMYAMSYMSEVLYWPLVLLLMYVWAVNERKQSYMLALLEGVICWCAYLTKEISVAFILAAISFEILYPIVLFAISDDRQGRRLKDYYSKKRFMMLLVFVVAFVVCFATAKMTIFNGRGYAYTGQITLDGIMSSYKFMYAVYAFFYHIAAILVTGLIVPFVYPAVNFKSMNDTSRKLFCYMLLLFAVISAIVVYVVTVRENLGSVKPSILQRYYGAPFLIMLMLFFVSLQDIDAQTIKRRQGTFFAVATILMMYVFFMFKGFIAHGTNDHYMLMWCLAVDMKIGVLFPPKAPGELAIDINRSSMNFPPDISKVIYLSGIVISLFLLVIVLLTHYYYTRKGAQKAAKVFAAITFIMCIVGNIASGVAIRFGYKADPEAVREVVAINNYFENEPDAEVMYLVYGDHLKRFDRVSRYMDTYMNRQHNFYIVRDREFPESINRISGGRLRGDILGYYNNVNKIDYIITHNLDSKGYRQPLNVEPIKELSGKYYTVYKNLNPQEVHLSAQD